MNILVFIKQIPEVNQISFDPETKRILRTDVPLIINPFDKRAVEEAVRIKEKIGSTVTVVTMGPPSASEVLNSSLRMGADRAILLTDRKFAGSDTLVTSKILSEVVGQIKPDLVLMGKYSLDGETSQVPPEVAELSGFSFKSSISKIDFELDKNRIRVEQDAENGTDVYEILLPSLLSVSEKINRARFVNPEVPDMTERIETWDSSRLSGSYSGTDDSPTVVEDTEQVKSFRTVRMLEDAQDAIEIIIEASRRVPSEKKAERVEIPPVSGNGTVLGVAVGDEDVSREIAGKLLELVGDGGHRIDMVGNIPPSAVEGMACHSYRYMKGGTVTVMADYVTYYIRRNKPAFVIFPSDIDGREIAGLVAARMDLGLTADCIDLKYENSRLVQFKPAFGGGIVARITSRTFPQMATVRPGMFREVARKGSFELIDVEDRDTGRVRFIETRKIPSEYTPLRKADIVFCVGKGTARKERMQNFLEITKRLGAALGGTRPVVDFGFLPRQQQIGITGVSVSPELYVALGVSGADNHVVGIRYAKKVLAVNSDPEAPIFRYADYGLVADANQFMEKLAEKLEVPLT